MSSSSDLIAFTCKVPTSELEKLVQRTIPRIENQQHVDNLADPDSEHSAEIEKIINALAYKYGDKYETIVFALAQLIKDQNSAAS